MAGTAVKASGSRKTEVRQTSVLREPERSGDFPNKQKSLSWLYYSSLNGCRS